CTPETIQQWFTRPTLAGAFTPTIKIRPTLDRSQEITSGAYQPTEQMREHVQLSHSGCVFPFCTRPAHVCDVDHTIPWKENAGGGATCTCNLVPACRAHHRLKTHGDNAPTGTGEHNTWTYTNLGNNEYYWKGPRGWAFIRTPDGTFDASLELHGGAPPHPAQFPTSQQKTVAVLGDDDQRDATETLITRLLTIASLTRGVHTTDYSPLWAVPTAEPSSEPPPDLANQWDDEGNYIGPTTFLMIQAPFPLTA